MSIIKCFNSVYLSSKVYKSSYLITVLKYNYYNCINTI